MTKKTFYQKTAFLIKTAVKLSLKAARHGISSLEDEMEDLDDEDLKQGKVNRE